MAGVVSLVSGWNIYDSDLSWVVFAAVALAITTFVVIMIVNIMMIIIMIITIWLLW